MSMSTTIVAGGTVVALGALGAVALATNGPSERAAVGTTAAQTTVAPAPEVRTETVTRVIHRTRHVRADRSAPLVAAPVAPARAAPPAALAPARPTAQVPRTSSSPVGHGGDDDHEHGDDHGGHHGDE